MKNVLFASTALICVGSYAAAEVTVGGDGRLGVIKPFDNFTFDINDDDEVDVVTDDEGARFNSRIRISFAASGETDTGLAFGGAVRADHYEQDQATLGLEGAVFISGAFGRLTFGDVDSAAEQSIGDLSGVGYTGIGDLNEFSYLLNADLPSVLYEYSIAGGTVYASIDNPNPSDEEEEDTGDADFALGGTYDIAGFALAAGVEFSDDSGEDVTHFLLAAAYSFGDAAIKVSYGTADDLDGFEQYGASVDYAFGATTVTGFYMEKETDLAFSELDYTAIGVGASYDLGGGAALTGGVVNADFDNGAEDTAYDFGVNLQF